MKKTLLIVILFLLTGLLQAADTDVHVAIEAGYNYSPQAPMHGLQIGCVVDLPFPYATNDPHLLGLEMGLDYDFGDHNYLKYDATRREAYQQLKESVVEHGGYLTTYSEHVFWHSINIPIRICYTYSFHPEWNFHLFSGPAIRLNVAVENNVKHCYKIGNNEALEQTYSNYISGESYTLERYNEEETKNEYSIDKSERLPCFDLAWGLGFGFSWKNISLNMRYDLDLLMKPKPRDVLAVTIAYYLL